MPIVCDWCNLSIHRSEVSLSLTELEWGMEWNARRAKDWSKDDTYEDQDGRWIGVDGTFYGLNESTKLGIFTPKYVTIDVYGEGHSSLENQLGSLARYSSSGETAVRPSGHFCEECFEEIAQQCIECSGRAVPPFDRGGWMGFTSKHVFTGDMNQPPLMIAVCAAKLDCIDCEGEEHSLHVVYIPGNRNKTEQKQVQDGGDDDGNEYWVDSGDRWRRSDLELGRGPMVDYLRRGEWNSWIFNVFVEYDQETRKTTVPCPFFDGALTSKGWVCWDCD